MLHLCWSAGEFLKGYTHLIKVCAEMCSIFVVLEAGYTYWNLCQQDRSLKKCQDHVHVAKPCLVVLDNFLIFFVLYNIDLHLKSSHLFGFGSFSCLDNSFFWLVHNGFFLFIAIDMTAIYNLLWCSTLYRIYLILQNLFGKENERKNVYNFAEKMNPQKRK